MPNHGRSLEKTQALWADPEWAAQQAKHLKQKPGQKRRGYQAGKHKGEDHWRTGKSSWNKKDPVVRVCAAEGCENVISTPPSLVRIRFCSHSCQARTTNRRDWSSRYDWGDNPYGGDWPETRERIWQRDGHRCLACGKRAQRLEAHHLCYDRSCRDTTHLVTLCSRCHQGGHRRGAWPIELGHLNLE